MNRNSNAGLNRRHPSKFPQSVPAARGLPSNAGSGMAYNPAQPRTMPQPEVTIIELSSQEGSASNTQHSRPHAQMRVDSMAAPSTAAHNRPKFGQAPDQRRNVPQCMAAPVGTGVNRGMGGTGAINSAGVGVPGVTLSRDEVMRRMQLDKQRGNQGIQPQIQAKKRSAEGHEARSTTPPTPAPGGQRNMRPLSNKHQGQTMQQRNPEIPMPPAAPLPTFLVPGDIAGAHSILGKLDLGKIWSDVARRQKAAVTDDPEWDKASAAHDAFGETMEKAMFFFNTLIGRYNDLASRKNEALADKQDLTRSYENAGAQLSKQCTNLDASTQQIKMPNPKRMRIKNVAENRD